MTGACDLSRFVDAQERVYAAALAEIRGGAKRSHWMWFVFPQLKGLGHSETAQFYALSSAEDARGYLAHPLLGARYHECVDVLQHLPQPNATAVFGTVDALKLRSSLTLFEAASGHPLCAAALDRWFGGTRDDATLHLLGQ